MLFQPDIETMPLDKLRKLQSERLRHLVAYVYERVPFYKKQLDEHGIKPSDIRDIGDLHKLPFTKKYDLRDNYPFDLFAVPMSEVIRIHASSGTTGKPTVVGYTRKDIDTFSEVVARSLAASGCRPGMASGHEAESDAAQFKNLDQESEIPKRTTPERHAVPTRRR